MTTSMKPTAEAAPAPSSPITASALALELIHSPMHMETSYGFLPLGPKAAIQTGIPPGELPKSIDELPIQISRTYELSATAAAELRIPVIGSVSGGFSRRVVVLERTAYKELDDSGTTYQYGYAIRLGITVSKLTSDVKATLPFLAASAELGQIEAKWILQVLGLSGSKIDSVALPPTELNVETFVLAKQSLTSLIQAVRDSTTTFSAEQIGVMKPADVIEREYLVSIGRAYALGRLEKGRKRGQALSELGSARDELRDTVVDTYKDYAGITVDNEDPSAVVRGKAATLLGPVKVEPR
jgi:hypothetical protein